MDSPYYGDAARPLRYLRRPLWTIPLVEVSAIIMRISWNWLRQYIDTDLTPQQAANVLTSTGLETESVELFEPVKGMLAGVVVGHVVECVPHPDADRLSVTHVDVGQEEMLQIVCGAPNVGVGQKVMVATVGTIIHLPDGTSFPIKKSKIRGQESHGMICAEDELGLGKSHAGIMVLDAVAPIGMAASEFLGLRSDHVLEIGLTPNRTDAMGHVGVARDLRAAQVYRTGATVTFGLPSVEAWSEIHEPDAVAVEVQDTEACPRYAGVTLRDVKVGSSPKWMQERLLAIGLKPINNIVDVTNYVQHELGQPLHAFDADRLNGRRIVVRKARAAEPFTALDGRSLELTNEDLVIADAETPACIAGVFGGIDSGVTENTVTVFLESACFNATSVRRTARRHGLNTDASFRFERGVDPELTVYALKRAALLLHELAGARVASSITDIDHRPKEAKWIDLSFAACDRLTGITIAPDDVVRVLELLDFRIGERSATGLAVMPPSYRTEVTRPADVIEEILRIHGYDEVPVPERLLCPPVVQSPLNSESLGAQLGAQLVSRGLREIMAPSLVNGSRSEQDNTDLVRLQNPLSTELDVLRPTMLFGALSAIAYNNNRQHRDLRFFERGRTYRTSANGTVETPTLAITLTGRRYLERWRSDDRKSELADAKEEVELLLSRLGLISEATWVPMEHPLLRNAHRMEVAGRKVGVIGEVDAAQLKASDVGQAVYYAELHEQALLEACMQHRIGYQEVAKFPAARRDLSLLIDGAVRFEQLRELAFNAERKLLREVDLFDVYQGDKLPAGKKSYALSFQLQDHARTLTDEQVEKAMGRIREALAKGVGAEVRS